MVVAEAKELSKPYDALPLGREALLRRAGGQGLRSRANVSVREEVIKGLNLSGEGSNGPRRGVPNKRWLPPAAAAGESLKSSSTASGRMAS